MGRLVPTSTWLPLAQLPPAELLSPALILLLCVLAGIGTVMLLPGKRERTLGKIGGALIALAGLILLASLAQYAAEAFHATTAVYFWIFSAIAVIGAIRVVTHPRPVYSALYFVLTVFASAGLFILLEAEFLAAALVLIYAGAILITYLFVIMLASQATAPSIPTPAQRMIDYDGHSREPLAAAAVGFALMGVLLFLIFDRAGSLGAPAGPPAMADGSLSAPIEGISGSTQTLGLFLFRHQFVQLELAGLILTLGMVGAMVIAHRQVWLGEPVGHPGPPQMLVAPATPIDDNPHSIPVYGTDNPRQKEYPER